MAASSSVDVIYVPADCGSILPGKSKAPKAFQDVGIVRRLGDAGISSVSEHHALEAPVRFAAVAHPPGGIRNEDLNVTVCQKVKDSISKNLAARADTRQPPFQLIIGGECCMCPAILSAFWHSPPKQRVGLLYIDADLDLASPTDPDSIGTLAGMNMTHLLGRPGALQSMATFSQPTGEPVCDASNTVFFGINFSSAGNKPSQFASLFDESYRVISSTAVAKNPQRSAEEAIRYLEERVDVIMVHLDVDAIDPLLFPLANVPNFTGVKFEQMMEALTVILRSEKVGGLTVAEVNPDHDPDLVMVAKLTDEIVEKLAWRAKG